MIKREDILAEHLDLAPAVKDTFIERWGNEAIRFELKKAIDHEIFYFKLEKELKSDNELEGRWLNIYNPYEYLWNGEKYRHEGLKLAFVYWTYSRYIEQGNLASTPFGMIIKVSESSQQASLEQINFNKSKYLKQGYEVFSEVKKYMERDDDFQDYRFRRDWEKDDRDLSIGVINYRTRKNKEYPSWGDLYRQQRNY